MHNIKIVMAYKIDKEIIYTVVDKLNKNSQQMRLPEIPLKNTILQEELVNYRWAATVNKLLRMRGNK